MRGDLSTVRLSCSSEASGHFRGAGALNGRAPFDDPENPRERPVTEIQDTLYPSKFPHLGNFYSNLPLLGNRVLKLLITNNNYVIMMQGRVPESLENPRLTLIHIGSS
jgi:hypothetical protein